MQLFDCFWCMLIYKYKVLLSFSVDWLFLFRVNLDSYYIEFSGLNVSGFCSKSFGLIDCFWFKNVLSLKFCGWFHYFCFVLIWSHMILATAFWLIDYLVYAFFFCLEMSTFCFPVNWPLISFLGLYFCLILRLKHTELSNSPTF